MLFYSTNHDLQSFTKKELVGRQAKGVRRQYYTICHQNEKYVLRRPKKFTSAKPKFQIRKVRSAGSRLSGLAVINWLSTLYSQKEGMPICTHLWHILERLSRSMMQRTHLCKIQA